MEWYNSTTIIVDDTYPGLTYFPEAFQYGPWNHAVTPPEEGDYNNTLTTAESIGFSVSFTFSGVAVEVYGELSNQTGGPVSTSTYSIDDTWQADYTRPLVATSVPRVLFFRSPPLPEGEHTLVITLLAPAEPYELDYILYTPGIVDSVSSLVAREEPMLTKHVAPPFDTRVPVSSTGLKMSLLNSCWAAPFAVLTLAMLCFVVVRALFLRSSRRQIQYLDPHASLGPTTKKQTTQSAGV